MLVVFIAQQVKFQVSHGSLHRYCHPSLVLAGLAAVLRLGSFLHQRDEARYYWDRNGALSAIDPLEPQVDLAVFLIRGRAGEGVRPAGSETLVES